MEYSYSPPSSVMTGTFGQMQYTADDGTTYTGFKYFIVKIVLLSSDAAIVPRVADLRALAVQV